MKAYWNKASDTRATLKRDREGRRWLYTGDIASMDQDGFTTIVQRKKDMAIVGGFNVYPSEVENVLMMHPAVSMAAAIGVPHAVQGETVQAYVVLRDGAGVDSNELLAHCGRYLAAYKRPRMILVRDRLPVTTVGKILYRVLRDEAAQVRSAV
jgi:long-chain acyl-CoA synthetase